MRFGSLSLRRRCRALFDLAFDGRELLSCGLLRGFLVGGGLGGCKLGAMVVQVGQKRRCRFLSGCCWSFESPADGGFAMAENHETVELGNRDCNCSACPSTSTSTSTSSVYYSTRMEGLLQSKSDYETALDFDIAASKDHWSELEESLSAVGDSCGREKGEAPMTNSEIVSRLWRQFPQTGRFFSSIGDVLVLGEKIAEGTQAEIFEAKEKELPDDVLVEVRKILERAGADIFEALEKDLSNRFVLKVFKEGSSVLDLQKQWPLGMFNRCKHVYLTSYPCSPVFGGTVVLNGRFAFLMARCAGDLRKLLDKRMERNGNRFCAPLSGEELEWNMLCIARGMKALHNDNVVHRDLKASNVLIQPLEEHLPKDLGSLPPGSYLCQVADYECSVGVVGTAFWRAPEILQGMKVRKITPDLFTKEADVYSFAMTCYEMITGRLPFEGVERSDYDVVLRGDRPPLPLETKPWMKTLLSKCWDSNPKERPSFEEITKNISCHKAPFQFT